MASINRNFGNLIEGALTYAPSVLVIDGRTILNPNAESYAAAGYLPVVDAAPIVPPREGYHYTPDGWEEREGAIRRVWREEANPPPPPRRWTRLDILTALGESDMFDAAVAYLNSIEVKPHITAWLGLNTANYIEDGYPTAEAWNALLDGAAVALGKSRAEIDAFLAQIPTEG
jgi:hypothetical protein